MTESGRKDPPTRGAQSLSVSAWLELARQGNNLPVTLCLEGHSMEPLIRKGRDKITVIPVRGAPLPGDVVLFRRADGAYAVHRLYWIRPEEGLAQTWGDNCLSPDAPLPIDGILGLVVSVERRGKPLRLDTDRRRRRGLRWLESRAVRPVWFLWWRIRRRLRRMFLKQGKA